MEKQNLRSSYLSGFAYFIPILTVSNSHCCQPFSSFELLDSFPAFEAVWFQMTNRKTPLMENNQTHNIIFTASMSAYCLRSGFDYLSDFLIEMVQSKANASAALKVSSHSKIVKYTRFVNNGLKYAKPLAKSFKINHIFKRDGVFYLCTSGQFWYK